MFKALAKGKKLADSVKTRVRSNPKNFKALKRWGSLN